MKNFLTAIWVVISLVVLFVGNIYWNEKTDVKANVEKSEQTPSISTDKKETTVKLMGLAKNWPETAQSRFQQTLNEKIPFKILFVGSSALGMNGNGWAQNVARRIIDTYGSKQIETDILIYEDTSKEFIEENKQQELAAENADLILFEPFLLNDNDGMVGIQDSLSNLSTVIHDVEKINPDTTFILQPSYPLNAATFYPQQEESLKNFAAENKIAYLDHWTAWPNSNDPTLKDYLLPDQSGPNEKGIVVWEKFVVDYFVSQD
jgi:hypothetical protein